MASIYSKFNCDCNGNSDCRAYYQKENGTWQRIGGNELNNVQKAMTESEVEIIALSLNVPFSSLKTEIETNPRNYTVWFRKIFEQVNEHILNRLR